MAKPLGEFLIKLMKLVHMFKNGTVMFIAVYS